MDETEEHEIYQFETDETKCGFCNYRTHTHYVIAGSREAAESIFDLGGDDEQNGRGFCGRCLVEQVIESDYTLVPN